MNESDIDLVFKKLQNSNPKSGNLYSLTPPPTALKAGVLLLLYPTSSQIHAVFIKRVINPNDKHSGQIALPGGKYEPTDSDLQHTALRESQEEIGVNPSKIEVIHSLTPLYIPISNFLVSAFVGWSPQSINFVPDPTEVDQILQVPLSGLINQYPYSKFSLEQNSMPHFTFDDHKIWGATALIVHEFVELISN
jgi:8-oxo-dGTP pyrophosphatase MutT (NUDIX family)